MPRKRGEKPEQYKERMIDPISSSFCAAKWLMATINLGAGKSRSCHHPSEHSIPVEEVQRSPSAIHNTEFKKRQRRLMLQGERPVECSYCWRIEDMEEKGTVADRVFYTCSFQDRDVMKATRMPWNENIIPKNLEISFDRICNFACSYCSSNYSTTWAKDIKTAGPYRIHPDNPAANYFSRDGLEHEPYGKYNDGNPFVQAFWDWWPELREHLEILRVTGGEPLMSPHFWKLTDLIEREGVNPNMQFAVNSNFGGKFDLIQRITEFSTKIPKFSLYTSCEAHGKQAEYLRDGLDYNYWKDNVWYFIRNGKSEFVTLMMTVNALCLWSITDLYDDLLEMKAEYDNNHPLISSNMLRYPTFMSPLVLPAYLREERADHIESWLDRNERASGVTDFDRYGIRKLIAYLRKGQAESQNQESDEYSFYHFYKQYDQRRGKSFRDTFPDPLIAWYDELGEKYE